MLSALLNKIFPSFLFIGVRPIVKDHSYSEKGNQLPPHGLFYMHYKKQDNTYHSLCYTSCGTLDRIASNLMHCHWKKIFYLMTHSTHFIHSYMASNKVNDHSGNEIGNPLLIHGLLFPVNSKGSFICTIPVRIAHTMTFVIPVMVHWLERKIANPIAQVDTCCCHYLGLLWLAERVSFIYTTL